MREQCKQDIVNEFRTLELQREGIRHSCLTVQRHCRVTPSDLDDLLRCCPAPDAAEPPSRCRFKVSLDGTVYCKCPVALRRATV